MKSMKLAVIISLMALVLGSVEGCYNPGGGQGAAVGGLAGLLLDRSEPWRGGIIGAAAGAIAGATLYDISHRGARESAQTGQPVRYYREDGRGNYEAEPLGYDDKGCRKVRERIYQDGQLVKKRIVTFCDEEQYRDPDRDRYKDRGKDDGNWKRYEREEQ